MSYKILTDSCCDFPSAMYAELLDSGAVAEVSGNPAPGETVAVVDGQGRFLARAAWSPDSQLVARVWSFDENEAVDDAFFERRIRRAAEFRRFLGYDDPEGGCRLIFSEADGLPGLVVYMEIPMFNLNLESITEVDGVQLNPPTEGKPTTEKNLKEDARKAFEELMNKADKVTIME